MTSDCKHKDYKIRVCGKDEMTYEEFLETL